MRTTTNSTRNTSSKSANNQQRKSFSNNLVILTGNLGADAACHQSGPNPSSVCCCSFGREQSATYRRP